MILYIVTAYRHGNREGHRYHVGTYEDYKIAFDEAYKEEEKRSHKYECEIIQQGKEIDDQKVIKNIYSDRN